MQKQKTKTYEKSSIINQNINEEDEEGGESERIKGTLPVSERRADSVLAGSDKGNTIVKQQLKKNKQ